MYNAEFLLKSNQFLGIPTIINRSQYPNKRIFIFVFIDLEFFQLKFGTMFPFHQGNELCFQISPNPIQQQNIPQDLLLDHPPHQQPYGATNLTHRVKNRGRRSISSVDNGDTKEETDKKKLLHRDIERQRRQEMTALYRSLRSLLPLEYIKVRI